RRANRAASDPFHGPSRPASNDNARAVELARIPRRQDDRSRRCYRIWLGAGNFVSALRPRPRRSRRRTGGTARALGRRHTTAEPEPHGVSGAWRPDATRLTMRHGPFPTLPVRPWSLK